MTRFVAKPDPQGIPNWRRQLRAALSLSGGNVLILANKLEVTDASVRNWLQGKHEPNDESKHRLRRIVLGLPPYDDIAAVYPLLPANANESDIISRLVNILTNNHYSKTVRIVEVRRQLESQEVKP